MKLIEKNSWVSDNGLWKVFYRVLEQDGIIVSEIRVRKSAGHNIWRDVRKKNIPKYVEQKRLEAIEKINFIKRTKRCKHENQIELIEIAGTTESIALCSDCKNEV